MGGMVRCLTRDRRKGFLHGGSKEEASVCVCLCVCVSSSKGRGRAGRLLLQMRLQAHTCKFSTRSSSAEGPSEIVRKSSFIECGWRLVAKSMAGSALFSCSRIAFPSALRLAPGSAFSSEERKELLIRLACTNDNNHNQMYSCEK